MSRMGGIIFLFLFPAYLYCDIIDVYNKSLDNNLEYKQALLKLEEAELGIAYFDKNYIPTISIGTSGSQLSSQGVSMTNGEFNPYTIGTEVTFEHIFGTTIQLSLPYSWDNESGHRFTSPSLRISRPLFEESNAEYLEAQAALLAAEHKLQEIEAKAGISLVKDIFSAYYSAKLESLYSRYKTTLKQNLADLRNEKDRNALKRKIFSIEKQLLQARYSGETSDLYHYIDSNDLDRYYAAVEEMGPEWEKQLPGLEGAVEKRKDLDSLEASLLAAQAKADISFLPFLPNPTFFASLTYNTGENQLDWGIGFTFSIPVLDHGERSLETRKREQGETIAKLTLENKKTEISNTIKSDLHEIDVLKIDLDILALDYQDAHDALTEAEKLYEKEIINEYDYTLIKLDYELIVLSSIQRKGNYYTYILDLMAQHSIDIKRLFE
ncbi:MAG: TolC family protein [Spirochaetales bacterium]|nr:TolC family protein [Spirochaetales bacterium]